MKKITLIFFTLSGIYAGFAQGKEPVLDSIVISKMLQDKPAVQLFPNPAKNKVELEISGFDAGYLQIAILNQAGRTVREEKRLLVGGKEFVVLMFSLSPGLYYLHLKQNSRSVRAKLIIQ